MSAVWGGKCPPSSRSSLILGNPGNPGNLGCESHDHDDLIRHLEAGDGEGAKAFMSHHLKVIEASLSIVEEKAEAPDLHSIFGG